MDNSLRQSIFERARDQQENAARWGFIAATLLAAFHLLTFTPYLDLVSRVSTTESELVSTREGVDSIDSITDEFSELDDVVKQFLEGVLAKLLRDLRTDFQTLQIQIAQPALDGGAPRDVPMPERHMQMQMMQSEMPTLLEFEIGPELADRIRQESGIDRLRRLLTPIVDAQIIAVRFESAQQSWKKHLTTRVEGRLVKLEQDLDALLSSEHLESQAQSTVDKTVRDTVAAIRNFSIVPPDDPIWWTSFSGKQQSLLEISQRSAEGFEPAQELEAIAHNLERSIEEGRVLLEGLNAEITQLEETFEDQKGQLAQFSSVFAVVPADLDSVVKHFPALLGAMLCGLWVWQARRIRDLRSALILIDPENSHPDLKRWLNTKLSSRALGGVAPALLTVGALWLWISLAGYQLVSTAGLGLPASDIWPAAAISAIAAAMARALHRKASAGEVRGSV